MLSERSPRRQTSEKWVILLRERANMQEIKMETLASGDSNHSICTCVCADVEMHCADDFQVDLKAFACSLVTPGTAVINYLGLPWHRCYTPAVRAFNCKLLF
jgi:hypothetical protein